MNKLWSSIKFYVYKIIYGVYYEYFIRLKTRKFRTQLNVLNSIETVHYILEHRCSVSRFGDGELRMITHYLRHGDKNNFNVDTFQQYDKELAKRLFEVLLSMTSGCLICIPYAFKDFSIFEGYEKFHFKREYSYYAPLLKKMELVLNKSCFGDASLTRFYYHRTDIKDYSAYVALLKQIWDNQNVVFIEGDKSRLGIGNDLFDNANTIQRFLLPSTNAFSKYNELLNEIKKFPKDRLYLIALGHTATVLAYDMAKLGFRAIDIGHIDVEYMWMKMKVTQKIAIPNKYVNEVEGGRITTDLKDSKYVSQIIGRIV